VLLYLLVILTNKSEMLKYSVDFPPIMTQNTNLLKYPIDFGSVTPDELRNINLLGLDPHIYDQCAITIVYDDLEVDRLIELIHKNILQKTILEKTYELANQLTKNPASMPKLENGRKGEEYLKKLPHNWRNLIPFRNITERGDNIFYDKISPIHFYHTISYYYDIVTFQAFQLKLISERLMQNPP
jgi:hypothetical protein